jgi:hypothetical protein
MLRKVLNAGPRLSKGAVRLFASLAILLYVTMYWKAGSFLPEFVFRDSDKIQSQVSGSSTYQDSSFDAVAKFYSALGGIGSNLFVAIVGAVFIWLMIGYSKRLGGLLLNTVLNRAVCVLQLVRGKQGYAGCPDVDRTRFNRTQVGDTVRHGHCCCALRRVRVDRAYLLYIDPGNWPGCLDISRGVPTAESGLDSRGFDQRLRFARCNVFRTHAST